MLRLARPRTNAISEAASDGVSRLRKNLFRAWEGRGFSPAAPTSSHNLLNVLGRSPRRLVGGLKPPPFRSVPHHFSHLL